MSTAEFIYKRQLNNFHVLDIAKNENNMSIQDILDKKDRKIAGKTAPACGLFFLGPKYPDELQLNTCEENIFDRYKI